MRPGLGRDYKASAMAYHLTASACESGCTSGTAYPRFAGYEAGLRFYTPGLGRWVSRDPVGEMGGVNPLLFIANGPGNAADAFGLFEVPEWTPTWFQSQWTHGPVGWMLSIHSWVAYVVTLIYRRDPWGSKFMFHYLTGNGEPIVLSREDVKSINSVRAPIINVWLHPRTGAALNAHTSVRIDSDIWNDYGAGAGTGNLSLGQFSIEVRGNVCCPEGSSCTFSGEFRLLDRYDFDPHLFQSEQEREHDHRSGWGEFEVVLMWLLTTGHGFPVQSEWIPVSASDAGPSKW